MLKRFLIGFTLGFGLMYWYIYQADDTVTEASRMLDRSASQYRNDRAHDAAREVLGTR
jgi:hypothetical protein